jgi:hypothetical protein
MSRDLVNSGSKLTERARFSISPLAALPEGPQKCSSAPRGLNKASQDIFHWVRWKNHPAALVLLWWERLSVALGCLSDIDTERLVIHLSHCDEHSAAGEKWHEFNEHRTSFSWDGRHVCCYLGRRLGIGLVPMPTDLGNGDALRRLPDQAS